MLIEDSALEFLNSMQWEVPGYYWRRGSFRLRGRAAPWRRSRREGGLEVVLLGHRPGLPLRRHLRLVSPAAQAGGGQLREEARSGGLPRHGPDARRVHTGYPPTHLGEAFSVSFRTRI